jgi:acyl-CoA thioesterase-1
MAKVMTSTRMVVAVIALAATALVAPPYVGAFGQTSGDFDDRPVILAVGESTTAGFGVPRELSYPSQLQQELEKRGYRYRVVNHGVSGSTTSDALTRLDRGVALFPKIVIIALGGNDGGSRMPAARTRDNFAKLISMFRRIGAEVFVADRDLRERGDPNSESLLAGLAREHRAILMPPLLSGVSGHPDLLIEDGRHPNGAGYTIVVRNLLPIIEPYLKREIRPSQ